MSIHVTPGKYVHNKSGKKYEVIGTALQTETNERLVIYKPLYDSDHTLYARPYDMFVETAMINGEKKPRFEKIDD